MYVCMYAYKTLVYLHTYVHTSISTYLHIRLATSMQVSMNFVSMYVRMYVCMYVCMYAYISFFPFNNYYHNALHTSIYCRHIDLSDNIVISDDMLRMYVCMYVCMCVRMENLVGSDSYFCSRCNAFSSFAQKCLQLENLSGLVRLQVSMLSISPLCSYIHTYIHTCIHTYITTPKQVGIALSTVTLLLQKPS